MNTNEPTMIGLSERAHGLLSQLKEDGEILEMADGYRLAIALALARGVDAPEVPTPKKTVFSVATIDPEREIACAISQLVDLDDGSVYRMAERLAEWGVKELASMADEGALDIGGLLTQTVGNSAP